MIPSNIKGAPCFTAAFMHHRDLAGRLRSADEPALALEATAGTGSYFLFRAKCAAGKRGGGGGGCASAAARAGKSLTGSLLAPFRPRVREPPPQRVCSLSSAWHQVAAEARRRRAVAPGVRQGGALFQAVLQRAAADGVAAGASTTSYPWKP